MTRVLLAEDHTLMRDGLRRVLEGAGLEIVGEVSDGEAAIKAATTLRPDVVVMDVSLPRCDGITAARELRSRAPEVGVVFLSMFDDDDTITASADAGGRAYLVKDCSVDALTDTVHAVAASDDLLVSYRGARPPVTARGPGLSGRELEVLRLVASGASSADIAATLYVSQKTVKNHLASIYDKLGVHDRTQAVVAALHAGLVSLRAEGHRSAAHTMEMGRSAY